jgi:hypothetical protein
VGKKKFKVKMRRRPCNSSPHNPNRKSSSSEYSDLNSGESLIDVMEKLLSSIDTPNDHFDIGRSEPTVSVDLTIPEATPGKGNRCGCVCGGGGRKWK